MALGPDTGRPDEDHAADLRSSAHWKRAVRGLRIAGLGLAVAVGGLVTRVWSTGIGSTILAIGLGVYLVGVVFVYAGFIPAIRALPKPRPSCWKLRRALMHDALHTRA
jgi:hypothetical protein